MDLPYLALSMSDTWKFLFVFTVNLMDDQKLWFMDYYRQLCRVGLSDKAKSKEAEPSSPSIKVGS